MSEGVYAPEAEERLVSPSENTSQTPTPAPPELAVWVDVDTLLYVAPITGPTRPRP